MTKESIEIKENSWKLKRVNPLTSKCDKDLISSYNVTPESYMYINPLNPKSDKHLISPYKITPESHMKVMRIKEMITREGTFWFANKFSLSAPQ